MFEDILTKDEEKFNELERKIYKFVCLLGCFILKTILELNDKKIMKTRDKTKYRHKGYRKNTIKTIMGEVEYCRAIYEINEKGIKKTVYLLDEIMHINTIGKVSENLAASVVEIVPITDSYRKAEIVLKETTNTILSFEAIRTLIVKIGDTISKRERDEIKLYKKNQLIAGLKQITALFEEADGIWIKLQGKDRQDQLEKYKKTCIKRNKEISPNFSANTELKLHVMYEGWKKDDPRHSLVNKEYMAGIMKPKEISKLRDARVYQKYDLKSIKMRVVNGDGAKWTKNIKSNNAVYQKDLFHIEQEIVRDVPKEYRQIFYDLINQKEYSKIDQSIELLKYKLNGEYNKVKKLDKLKKYLSNDLERYTDLLEVPEAPEGIEYRTMGTQESQIFSMLEKRFCSGRKAFSKHGANALSKVCVLRERFNIEEIEEPIPIDTSVEDWIKEIEKEVNKNKRNHRIEEPHVESIGAHIAHIENNFVKEILKIRDISELRLSY